jgi:sugar/nucleoside kinase (ribokinase family)
LLTILGSNYGILLDGIGPTEHDNQTEVAVSEKRRVVGVGSALVDVLLHEDELFVSRLAGAKGGMTLVEKDFIRDALARTDIQPLLVPGGSACNTIVGVGRLGGECRLVGKLGDDKLGQFFREGLQASNVEPCLTTSETATGQVLSIVTPDAERTMFTYLGAAAEMTPDEITSEPFENANIVHVEGYLLFNHDLIKKVMETAAASGARISLDLASFTVVEASQEYLGELVDKYVDILLANEDEARTFTGHSDESQALAALSERAEYAVLKIGKRGSLIAHGTDVISVPPEGDGSAVDTTGAGDLWASGFLYGLVHELPLAACGAMGSACGFEVCQVSGASIPNDGWQRIKKRRDELMAAI